MTDQPKRGKRVQIYLPADLLERWEQTPRYERSATVAAALRAFWGIDQKDAHQDTGDTAQPDKGTHRGKG